MKIFQKTQKKILGDIPPNYQQLPNLLQLQVNFFIQCFEEGERRDTVKWVWQLEPFEAFHDLCEQFRQEAQHDHNKALANDIDLNEEEEGDPEIKVISISSDEDMDSVESREEQDRPLKKLEDESALDDNQIWKPTRTEQGTKGLEKLRKSL